MSMPSLTLKQKKCADKNTIKALRYLLKDVYGLRTSIRKIRKATVSIWIIDTKQAENLVQHIHTILPGIRIIVHSRKISISFTKREVLHVISYLKINSQAIKNALL